MKKLIPSCLAVAALTLSLITRALAGPSPAEVDFGKLGDLAKGAKYIEINLGKNLISLAARLVARQEPEAATLLRSIEQLKVTVIGLREENRKAAEQRVTDLRTNLTERGWERIVTVQEERGEDVGIFLKSRGDEAVEGLVITVVDSRQKEAVFIHLTGDIKVDQLAKVGEALDIDPLKHVGAAVKK